MSIEQKDSPVGNYTQFELYISDKMIQSQNLQSILTQLIPTVSFCLWQIEMNVYEFLNNILAGSYNEETVEYYDQLLTENYEIFFNFQLFLSAIIIICLTFL